MRGRISYVTGYGWHAGRLFVWPVLLVASFVGFWASVMLEVVLQLATGTELPFAVIGPALYVLWMWRRIRRKLRGEPFVWESLMHEPPNPDIDVVHRHHDERRWKSLLRMELLGWGGPLLVHLAMLVHWWTRDTGR